MFAVCSSSAFCASNRQSSFTLLRSVNDCKNGWELDVVVFVRLLRNVLRNSGISCEAHSQRAPCARRYIYFFLVAINASVDLRPRFQRWSELTVHAFKIEGVRHWPDYLGVIFLRHRIIRYFRTLHELVALVFCKQSFVSWPGFPQFVHLGFRFWRFRALAHMQSMNHQHNPSTGPWRGVSFLGDV